MIITGNIQEVFMSSLVFYCMVKWNIFYKTLRSFNIFAGNYLYHEKWQVHFEIIKNGDYLHVRNTATILGSNILAYANEIAELYYNST